MAAGRRRKNVFQILLIPAGLLFVLTAIAYGIMAFSAVNGDPAAAARQARHPLFAWLRVHGDATLLGELGLLAVVTVGVILGERDAPHEDPTGKHLP
jgi:hypothetical protein